MHKPPAGRFFYKIMRLYSTNNKNTTVSLEEAVMSGVAENGGLFMPKKIPRFAPDFYDTLPSLNFQKIAFHVAKALFGQDLSDKNLKKMVDKSFDFDIKLKKFNKKIYALELFFGPTLAFKDFGARFMAQLVSYYARKEKKKLTVLVATSGDTGSAVASSFYKVLGIDVILLYPKGKVSKTQEKQLTTMDGNIKAIEIKGTFDDCQSLVKRAFQDSKINKVMTLTSANSINVARLFPQIFYYFYAFAKLKSLHKPLIFSIPCGNLGNLTAAIFAKRMGLPIAKLIAATNQNDVFSKYIKSGIFKQKPSISTLSNAMDVGNPSNFARILELYNNDVTNIRKDVWSESFTDQQTIDAIKQVFNKYNYILDPHSAVAYLGLTEYLKKENNQVIGIFLATAHPAKFPELIEEILRKKVNIPKSLEYYLNGKKKSTILSNRFSDFKKYLLDKA